jgi:hypothetical protein
MRAHRVPDNSIVAILRPHTGSDFVSYMTRRGKVRRRARADCRERDGSTQFHPDMQVAESALADKRSERPLMANNRVRVLADERIARLARGEGG